MNITVILISTLTGFFLGTALTAVITRHLYKKSQAQHKQETDLLIEKLKNTFSELSSDALSRTTDEFFKLAKSKLESERELTARELISKKELIDQQLNRMSGELENVSTLMNDLEKDRTQKFGELSNQLKTVNEQNQILAQTTNSLREALASTKSRGQWGERMAEDVLRLTGLIENVNYLKQKTIEDAGSRPDFTFLLPRELKLNMDVKFPLDNYARYVECDSKVEKKSFRDKFMSDVKLRIKEITTREYINPEQNTVDYVLLFIPNEQIYAFIHEQDSAIFDNAIKEKVIICSPITLFAILAVVRQAVDNFTLEKTSNEILSLLGRFKKEWGSFVEKLKKVGERIGAAQKEHESLITTRKRQLEKPLNKIDLLRTTRNLPLPPKEEEPTPPNEDPADNN
ncbi:MAG: DNA recombination protein RmuC [Candidatus Omnitrophica bacterium]|nr:DNA recombination protein RmuC [Candidatus Omnitrophota bacterium]